MLAVALGVLAMHDLARPAQAQAQAPWGHVAAAPLAHPVSGTIHAVEPSASGDALGADGCGACSHHPVAMALCILTLVLLVIAWRWAPPPSRPAPPAPARHQDPGEREPLPSRPPSRAELAVYRI